MNHPRGSLWRKWDLHVHTPSSLYHNYQTDDSVWDRFYDDIESLPRDIKVLGINDYIFIDGYRRVVEAQKSGRLSNIELILPVLELRLDKFGGSKGSLSRVNFHVIFSNELAPDVIQEQFLNALTSSYQLSPFYEPLSKRWSGTISRSSLGDLGKLIKESVPVEERKNFASDIMEGFNGLNVSLDRTIEILESSPYLENKYLTAVGKTEWADIKWNDHSIADKKNIINRADLVFIASHTFEDYKRAKEHLASSKVNCRLLDCSDAHCFSDSLDVNRLGNCFTWIKADTTFAGLRHAVKEFDTRVFVGDRPEKLRFAESTPTKYIRSLHVFKTNPEFEENWFNNHIEFNHDLVTIIGSKGSGKSALTDIISLLANTKRTEFSFLKNDRFRQRRKASHFSGTLTWESEQAETRSLFLDVPAHEHELVRYIPQRFFEQVCNEIASGDATEFETELKQVIFSHVLVEKRLGFDSLDKLIAYRTSEIESRLKQLRLELKEINEQIIGLTQQTSAANRVLLDKLIEAKSQELEFHIANKPIDVVKPVPNRELDTSIASLREQEKQLDIDIDLLREQIQGHNRNLAELHNLVRRLDNLEQHNQTFTDNAREPFLRFGFEIDQLVKISIDKEPLVKQIASFNESLRAAEVKLGSGSAESLLSQRDIVKVSIDRILDQLGAEDRQYQDYLTKLRQWEIQKNALIGDIEIPDSLNYVKNQREELQKNIPRRLNDLRELRVGKVRDIFSSLKEQVAIYQELYAPVQRFIDNNKLVQTEYALNFKVQISESNFSTRFLHFIDQSKRGSFYGIEDGQRNVRKILEDCDLQSSDGVIGFLQNMLENLENDTRDGKKISMPLDSQLKTKTVTSSDILDFLYSLEYLVPRYQLRLGEKTVQQLSPGERGALLLIFYLLVDYDDCPLIIDQPEDNLDNESIYKLLVPSIREAKKRRQLIMVTHNPNLAVVCDAEQVIEARIDKADSNRIIYITGSIENPTINLRIQDILEGTPPAFQNRKEKYHNATTSGL